MIETIRIRTKKTPAKRLAPATLEGANQTLDTLMRRVPYGVFGRTGRFTMSEQFAIQTIAKPRQHRDGSVTDEQVDAVFEAFKSDRVPTGEAVIITRGVEKEATARNRARSLVERMAERHSNDDGYKALSAHAIPDPDGTEAKPLWIGAVSVKPQGKPKTDDSKSGKSADGKSLSAVK